MAQVVICWSLKLFENGQRVDAASAKLLSGAKSRKVLQRTARVLQQKQCKKWNKL